MEDARTSLAGSSRCRSEVQREEEEEALGGRRGKGKADPSKNTWVGAADTRGQEGLSCSSLASSSRPPGGGRDHETRRCRTVFGKDGENDEAK